MLLASAGRAQFSEYDVIVYGGSSAGVIAATQAARMGKRALLISSARHIGGVTASGLGTTDVGNAGTIGGLAWAFYADIYRHYHATDTTSGNFVSAETVAEAGSPSPRVQFEFEPHAAEMVFTRMLRDAGASWIFDERLDRKQGVRRRGNRIASITMVSGRTFAARMFIDATYEGDLLAAAGVPYRVGRESAAELGESLAGVYRDTDLLAEVDPYRIPGQPSSGLLPGIASESPGPDGTGDHRVQQYNFRLCLTNVPENRVPITKPGNYDPRNYQLLARRLQQHPDWSLSNVCKIQPIPGGKTDINATGSFSTDMAGDESWRWAEADDEERAAIAWTYRTYTQGMFWFLGHDASVSPKIRAQTLEWGFPRDEFTDNGHWPWQLYVREARRMIGGYFMTQHDCERLVVVNDPVALGSYAMDSHKVTLFVDEAGRLNTEGFFFRPVSPYPISYRSIIPRQTDCANLLVPICISASHVAFNSMRMEPVYMMLGQSAATAACLAIDGNVAVQAVNYGALAARLKADGQFLTWPPSDADIDPATLIDEPDAPPMLPPTGAGRLSPP